jgi:Lantibiotic biosynthesis dehydratase C-term
MEPAELDDAVALFQLTGRTALAEQEAHADWFMARVHFRDHMAADQVIHDRLLPLLTDAQDQGLLAQWWFMRKPPGWRMRFLPGPGIEPEDLRNAISYGLGAMALRNQIRGWTHATNPKPQSSAARSA